MSAGLNMKLNANHQRIWSHGFLLWICVGLSSLLLFINASQAEEAMSPVQDEVVEKRLNAIVSELRCLVCQNESLAASNAGLARDLRREILAMIQSGKNDDEIMEFMVNRYGDFVRYRPPLKGSTLLLWFGPVLLFVAGIAGLFVFLRRRSLAVKDVPLSETERQRAEQLLYSDEP